MTEKEALLWVLGILGSLCAAAITIDKVLEIIHKYIKKAQAPDDAQNKLFPAHAGVILVPFQCCLQSFSFPRTCGGDPCT